MLYVALYYIVGVLVSGYFIYYYRLSPKTKSLPKKSDSIGGLIGPWLWPCQIVLHFLTRNNYKNG